MIRAMNQGQSLSTLDKERKLAAMFDMQGRLYQYTKALRPGDRIYHIDLNAGCGFNHDYQVPGSPLVFLNIMHGKYSTIPYRAWFIDYDPSAIDELQQQVAGRDQHLTILGEDNRVALQRLSAEIPAHAVGTLLADPNAWLCREKKTGKGVPVDEMVRFTRAHERMDLLMNLNARYYAMASGNPMYGHVYSVSDFGWLFHKAHWLITQPMHNGHSRFVCLIGRNTLTDGYKAYDWHRMDSKQGMAICEELEIKARRPLVHEQMSFSDGDL